MEELIIKLSQYSHAEQHSIYKLLNYIEGSADVQQQQETELLLNGNKHLAQIVKGLKIYYSLYGRNRQELMNYLQEVREEGFARISD